MFIFPLPMHFSLELASPFYHLILPKKTPPKSIFHKPKETIFILKNVSIFLSERLLRIFSYNGIFLNYAQLMSQGGNVSICTTCFPLSHKNTEILV